ncbi:MAG: metal ABC transporter substrate-binding protein [Spirochaetia bacterium]|nr:metal ABC transporter substrate-binding protein [Spirochaetia bacterium]
MKKIVFALAMLLSAATLAAKPQVVVSIVPLYNITKAITGDMADVTVMVPPGASPHTFSPKPGQLKSLAKADLFIMAGAGLEFWADKMVKASGNRKLKILSVTDGMALVNEEEHVHDGHEHTGSGNPHVWLDPVLAGRIAEKIETEVSLQDPANKPHYLKNLAIFKKKIKVLDAEIKTGVKKFRVKELVSFHPAWVYFESRYGLKEVGVIQTSPGKEPSPKQISDIIEQIKKYGITTIFAESQLPRKAADVIAKEAGVKVLILDPNGAADGDYPGFIRKNFNVMKEAMQ